MKYHRIVGYAVAAALAGAAPASAQMSGDMVKIGVLTDMSGPYSDNVGAGSVLAAQMAAEDFGGTVNGSPIEIVSADHQNKTDIGSTIAREWYDVEGVDAITEVVSSAVALAVQELAREKEKILLATGPGNPALTGEACSPFGIHWAYDNYAYGKVLATALVDEGKKDWFFITADYSFGQSLEAAATQFVKADDGNVLGAVAHPLSTNDFSAFLLQAQASGSDVVALANAGSDMTNAVKQANEFGLTSSGQTIAALLVNLPDIHALGLESAQGLTFAESFYWNMNDETREWSKRFMDRFDGRAPSSLQAAVYGAVAHYLKAIDAAGTDDATAVAAKMRELPVNDFYTKNATIREDGRLLRDMYLMRVKSPDQSSEPWDYYETVATIPGDEAFRPMSEGNCPLVK